MLSFLHLCAVKDWPLSPLFRLKLASKLGLKAGFSRVSSTTILADFKCRVGVPWDGIGLIVYFPAGTSCSEHEGRLGLDQIVADGVVDELNDGIDFQLAHDGCAMCLDGLDADAQRRGDLLVHSSLSQQLDDLALPICQD